MSSWHGISGSLGASLKASKSEFEKMKAYVIDFYSEAKVNHTFAIDEILVDCHRFDSQPSFRNISVKEKGILTSIYESKQVERKQEVAKYNSMDKYGRQMYCKEGFVPIVRHRLENLARQHSLEEYLLPIGVRTKSPTAAPITYHFYATANYAYGKPYPYYGSISMVSAELGLWNTDLTNPPVQMSVSQIWVERQNTPSGLQTVELGLINNPGVFETVSTVPFVFSTSNAYAPGSWCYNTCTTGHGITVMSSGLPLGAPFPAGSYSALGNEKRIPFQAMNNGSMWWITINGFLVGVYTASEFSTNPSSRDYLSAGAKSITIGGETATPGKNYMPTMGSGKLPPSPLAATQQSIFITLPDPTGTIGPSLLRAAVNPGPPSYDILITNNSLTGSKISYGGPGGVMR